MGYLLFQINLRLDFDKTVFVLYLQLVVLQKMGEWSFILGFLHFDLLLGFMTVSV